MPLLLEPLIRLQSTQKTFVSKVFSNKIDKGDNKEQAMILTWFIQELSKRDPFKIKMT